MLTTESKKLLKYYFSKGFKIIYHSKKHFQQGWKCEKFARRKTREKRQTKKKSQGKSFHRHHYCKTDVFLKIVKIFWVKFRLFLSKKKKKLTCWVEKIECTDFFFDEIFLSARSFHSSSFLTWSVFLKTHTAELWWCLVGFWSVLGDKKPVF